jgi:hypothetical protein
LTRTDLLFTLNNKYFVLHEEGFNLRLIKVIGNIQKDIIGFVSLELFQLMLEAEKASGVV